MSFVNYMFGWLAVGFVRYYFGIRASNKPGTPDGARRELAACLAHAPDSVRAQMNEFCTSQGIHPSQCLAAGEGSIVRLAQLAASKGCGNCAEQDAVALVLLKGIGARPLDLMELATYCGVDHTFAVLGRQSASKDYDPTTWGPDAMIVDPWHDHGKVYAASLIETKMFRGYRRFDGKLQPNSLWRHD